MSGGAAGGDHAPNLHALPSPRRPAAAYRVAIVCLGNICRSPMADVVLRSKLARERLDGAVVVTSSGTGDWHVGQGMDRRAASTLAASGYDPSTHRAEHFDATWFDRHDLILTMDSMNYGDVCALLLDGAERDRVRMFRAFDPLAGADLDVPDPWYGGDQGFEDVLDMVERTTDELLRQLTGLMT
ncbi:MAG: low molecular weight protein-tyrosine-phosphatase [Nocardioidaceae bacterium]